MVVSLALLLVCCVCKGVAHCVLISRDNFSAPCGRSLSAYSHTLCMDLVLPSQCLPRSAEKFLAVTDLHDRHLLLQM